jgi:hypothetical protein
MQFLSNHETLVYISIARPFHPLLTPKPYQLEAQTVGLEIRIRRLQWISSTGATGLCLQGDHKPFGATRILKRGVMSSFLKFSSRCALRKSLEDSLVGPQQSLRASASVQRARSVPAKFGTPCNIRDALATKMPHSLATPKVSSLGADSATREQLAYIRMARMPPG